MIMAKIFREVEAKMFLLVFFATNRGGLPHDAAFRSILDCSKDHMMCWDQILYKHMQDK